MTTISSSTTLTTAYQVAADTTGTLVLQTGSAPTTAVTIGSDQSTTFAGATTHTGASTFSSTVAVQSQYITPYTGFKNRIINGAMMIDQRNAGASINMASGDGGYCLDRWRTQKNGSGVLALQQSSTAPAGFSSSLKVTVSTSSTPSAGDYYTVGQIIEGFNFADMAWGTASNQPITISFWVQSSVTGTYTASVYNWAVGSYTYPATFTINSANTWEQKTITVTGATSAASGAWATGNTGSLYLRIDLGSGSTYSTATPNAWNSTGGFRVNGSVNLVSNSLATFYITGVQLEKGSTATSFDYRPYGTELALCQRYFQLVRAASGAANSSSNMVLSIQPCCEMRSGPSVGQTGVLSISTFLADSTQSSTGISYYTSYNNFILIALPNFTGLTGNIPYFLRGLNTNSITLSAEL